MTEVWRDMAVVIPTFQRNRELGETLEGLLRQDVLPGTVVIVDNSPTRTAKSVFDALHPPAGVDLGYIGAGRNLGPAGAYATAFRELARSEIIWAMCTDDDPPLIEEGLVGQVRRVAEQMGSDVAGIGLSGVRWSPTKGRSRALLDMELTPGAAIDVDAITGAGMPIYRLDYLLEAEANFDPFLFFGFEELHVGLRLRRAGKRLVVDADLCRSRRRATRDALADGKAGPIRRRSPWRTYFRHRNRYLISREFASCRARVRVVVRSVLGAGVAAVRRDFSEAEAITMGLLDGLRRRPPRQSYIP